MAVYLDSCIVIYLHEGVEALRQAVSARLARVQGRLYVSELTRLECRVGPLRRGDEGLLEIYDRFFSLPELGSIELGRDVFDRAALLRARHGWRTPDALHLAAALVHGCDAFWTHDLRLARPEVGIEVVALTDLA